MLDLNTIIHIQMKKNEAIKARLISVERNEVKLWMKSSGQTYFIYGFHEHISTFGHELIPLYCKCENM